MVNFESGGVNELTPKLLKNNIRNINSYITMIIIIITTMIIILRGKKGVIFELIK